jgi:hypothetical protein
MSADLDKAIDRAVREMLDVEPPADLRARVMARIEEPGAAPAVTRKLWWFAAPIAAAAIVVLAVLVPRRDQSGPQPMAVTPPSIAQAGPPIQGRPLPQVPQVEPPATLAHQATVAREMPRERRGNAVGAPDRGMAGAATIAVAGDAAANSVEPLGPIDPIAVAAIRPSDITPAAIDIGPLKPIAAIQVAPLTPPEGRN